MLLPDVFTYLIASSTRLTAANLTLGFMPDTPATVTTLYEQGGFAPDRYFSTGGPTRYDRPSLQVITRSTDQLTARTIIEDVYGILDDVANTNLPTSTGPAYVTIDAEQAPFLIDRDSNERFRFGVNFNVMKSTG